MTGGDHPDCDHPDCDHPDRDHPDRDHPDRDHPDRDHPDRDHPDRDHPDCDPRLAGIERQRLREQVTAVDARLAALSTGRGVELRLARSQSERDRLRLLAAVEGATPSAVLGRSPQFPDDDLAERCALARDEATHAADNALSFLGRFDAVGRDALLRSSRWLLRLELEVLDADSGVDPQRVRELAFELLRDGPPAPSKLVARAQVTVRTWRDELTSP